MFTLSSKARHALRDEFPAWHYLVAKNDEGRLVKMFVLASANIFSPRSRAPLLGHYMALTPRHNSRHQVSYWPQGASLRRDSELHKVRRFAAIQVNAWEAKCKSPWNTMLVKQSTWSADIKVSPGGLWYSTYPSLPQKPDPIGTLVLEMLLKANTIRQHSGEKHTGVVVGQGSPWVSWFLVWRNFTLLPKVSELLGYSSSPGETESRWRTWKHV